MEEKLTGEENCKYYSDAVTAGDFIFISGQGPIDADTGEIKGTTIEEQTTYTTENIFRILKKANAGPENIVKVNAYLSNISDFDKFNTIYYRLMPKIKPARTTVGAGLTGILVEIDCIAYIGNKKVI
jgi:2-iminobutanoate/2-iminopropanoate deaminase